MNFGKEALASRLLVVYKSGALEYARSNSSALREQFVRYDREALYEDLCESDAEHWKCVELVRALLPNAACVELGELRDGALEGVDVVVAVGGDEHFKAVVHRSGFDKVFLNVCSDHLRSEGVLSSCTRLSLPETLEKIRANRYVVEEWTTLDVRLNSQELCRAFDTVFLGNAVPTRMSRCVLQYGACEERQKSSGYVIATGAGSTGWFLSAGGSSFDRQEKKAAFIVREIYKGAHSEYLIAGGEILADGLRIRSLNEGGAVVDIDCVYQHALDLYDVLEVSVSSEVLRVIAPR